MKGSPRPINEMAQDEMKRLLLDIKRKFDTKPVVLHCGPDVHNLGDIQDCIKLLRRVSILLD